MTMSTRPVGETLDHPSPSKEAGESQLRADVRAFLAHRRDHHGLRPHCDSWMTSPSPEFSQALAEQGWIGMTWPEEYGGRGRPERERLVVVEELLAAGAPVAAHWFADRQVGPALLKLGTPAQRRLHLPAIARGERFFAIGMSEPDTGSDLASIRTRAGRATGGWTLRGTKIWTSHAHLAHYMIALVRTSPPDPGRRHEGMSQFIVDLSAPGVTVHPIVTLDGGHHFNEVVLDDVAVPDDGLLGREGEGWAQVMAELAYERSGPERFMSTAPLLFALARRIGVPHPALGELLAELRTLRRLSREVADALERGEAPSVRAALVKDLGSRFEGRVVSTARALAPVEPDADSGDDYTRLLAEAVLHAPDATLRGGTNEILRGIVGRELVSR
ncbi:acyl-CoA dehydrogenase family protein [Streptosporangium sp. G11]|uniref:acyl-CoA dehydrogenase family protein n=1 Tax=Streptosporangium sp. G11 TaxID=3436926 RepID=UPI003EBFCAA0